MKTTHTLMNVVSLPALLFALTSADVTAEELHVSVSVYGKGKFEFIEHIDSSTKTFEKGHYKSYASKRSSSSNEPLETTPIFEGVKLSASITSQKSLYIGVEAAFVENIVDFNTGNFITSKPHTSSLNFSSTYSIPDFKKSTQTTLVKSDKWEVVVKRFGNNI